MLWFFILNQGPLEEANMKHLQLESQGHGCPFFFMNYEYKKITCPILMDKKITCLILMDKK
jgi:hypothetical protein